jgi:hypothetical protein
VLGVEVLVKHAAQQQAPQPLVGLAFAVDQLVGGDDREAGASAHHDEHNEHVEREQRLAGEELDGQRDDGELQHRQQIDQQVEGPRGQRRIGLAALGPRGAVELVGHDQREEAGDCHVPGMGRGPEEEQARARHVERQQVADPESGHARAGRGVVCRRFRRHLGMGRLAYHAVILARLDHRRRHLATPAKSETH